MTYVTGNKNGWGDGSEFVKLLGARGISKGDLLSLDLFQDSRKTAVRLVTSTLDQKELNR